MWLPGLVTGWIQPITDVLLAKTPTKIILANGIVLLAMILIWFIIDSIARTKVGKFIHETAEQKLLKLVPGYNTIKKDRASVPEQQKSPYSSVALAQIFGNKTLVIALVTEEHEEGQVVTIFMPTGPNPP